MRNVYINLLEKYKKTKRREIRAQWWDTFIQEINRWYEFFIAVLIKIQAFL